jgi:O-antigen/teichoic acid export membrane protein
MMQVVIDIAASVFSMQVVQGVFRSYHAATTREGQDTVIASATAYVVLSKLIGVFTLVALSGPAATLLFGSNDLQRYMALFAVSLLTTSLFFMPFQYLRALERPVAFVALSVSKLALQLSLNIYFVVHLRMGVPGVIWATVLTGLSLGGAMATWALIRTRFSVSLEQIRDLVGFSWPLVLSGLVTLYVSAGARVLISRAAGLTDVGLFMLAQRLSGVMGATIWRPFNQAWSSQRFKLVGTEHGASTYARGFLMACVVLVYAAVGLSIFAPEVLRIMSHPAFWGAAALVPLLTLQSVIAAATQFSRFGLVLEGRTIEFLKASSVSAVAATAVALVLAPRFGAMGVAMALVVYAVVNLWQLEGKDRSRFDVQLPWAKYWALVGVGTIAYLLSRLAPAGLWASLAFKSVLYVAFVAVVYWSPIVGREERGAVLELAQDLLGRLRLRTRVG